MMFSSGENTFFTPIFVAVSGMSIITPCAPLGRYRRGPPARFLVTERREHPPVEPRVPPRGLEGRAQVGQPGFDMAAEIGRQAPWQPCALRRRLGGGRLRRGGLGRGLCGCRVFGGRQPERCAQGCNPEGQKARRFVRNFRPLALCIVRLEYAPR